MSPASPLVAIARDLSDRLAALRSGPPVTRVQDPTRHARAPRELHLERHGVARGRELLLVGMNPGPGGRREPDGGKAA